jgi:putative ABC transport system permease protein
MKPQPPKNALRFLRWFCREDYIEEIEGDLTELFEWRYETSPQKAKRGFIWDVCRSFRPRNIKINTPTNTVEMYKNYIKIALRVFNREKSFTFINILGLAIGLAVTLLIIQYVRFELSYENTNKNADNIVRLTMDYLDGGSVITQDCETYPPIGPRITAELPEVKNFTRAYGLGDPDANFKIGDQPFLVDKVYAADPSFFSIFDYPLLHGSREGIFDEPYQIVLTESIAKRFFNRVDVVNETIIIPQSKKDLPFKVVGVVPNSPLNTHFKFNVLISYPTMKAEWGEKDDNWNGNNTYTYVELAENTDYERFTTALASFSRQLNEEKKIENEAVIGQKIADIHLYSKKTFEPENNNDATTVFFLLGVAFLVIISAFVNYINLATSKALDRTKEVGVRKVVGSSKGQLRAQFLTETALINLFAGIFALIFISLFKNKFLELSGLPINFPIFEDPFFWLTLIIFIVLGILLSGAYPAIMLSSFKPSAVLKGSYTHSAKGVFLRKSLVVFQFAITIVLLIQTYTVFEQLNYMRAIDLGLNVDQTVVIKAPASNDNNQTYNAFKQELLNQANIKAVSFSGAVPGQSTSQFSTTSGINLSNAAVQHNYNFYIDAIDDDYIPLMGMELLAGENFKEKVNKEPGHLIVNEEAIKLWGIPNPEAAIGQKLDFWGRSWMIQGVLKNYYQVSPKSPHVPIILRQTNSFSTLASIQFSNEDARAQIATIENIYKQNYPNSPFSFFFLDSEYDKQFKADERFRDVFSVLTVVAIIIACLGLFGLASFTVAKRTKEIGVRKVIGASTFDIMVLLTSDFVKTVSIALLIGIPCTYFLIKNWLNNFAVRIDMDWWLFVLPALLVLILVIASLGLKTISTAMANPVECLKEE